ncbi:flavodoxin domain-containing protein [Halosolutus halophilus]|uniref:flavodoxin domain-containing protein n=1 Tax=Halosolutus halophilus TaxID=1552990 RepID=UPI0022352C40|nr:flavodoxin domain-containing protein [Halosolutus halophilus]
MTRILVAYGSTEGQTATIADRMGDVLAAEGHDVTLVHLNHPPAGLEPGSYDGVIVGGSIHMGSHQQYVTDFVHDQQTTLNRLPSAFFSVSLSSASADPEARSAAEGLLEEFLEETGWDPDGTLAVAGALKYSEYGLLKRFVMRRIARKSGGDTDVSRDHEYTDWDAVEAFAAEFATLL